MDGGDAAARENFQSNECNAEQPAKSSAEPRPSTLVQDDFDVAALQAAAAENLEFVTPTGASMTLLQAAGCESKAAMQGSMQGSMHSNASNSNTDICILEANESHYGMEQRSEEDNDSSHYCQQLDHSGSTIDAPDFTVLHAPTPSPAPPPTEALPQRRRQSNSCAFDESTEVLMHSTECNGRSMTCGYSGTDSDVEVLMSEEIIDSDWSAGAGALDELVRTPDEPILPYNATVGAQMISAPKNNNNDDDDIKTASSASIKRQESTDQDISVEEFSHSSTSACEQLPRAQLLQVIREQDTQIQQLEATLQRYRKAQRALFEHVEALRLALESEAKAEPAADVYAENFKRSHETIN